MPRAFDITAVTDSIRLDARGEGEVAFTVSNALRAPVRVRASVVPDGGAKAEWASVEGGEERDLTPDGTQQFTVQLKVPPGTPPGRFTFHLLVVDVSNPDERYAEGPTTAFEVVTATPPPPKPFPWALVALAAGILVIIIGVVAILASRGRGPGLGEPCPDGTCGKHLECSGADAGVDGGLSDAGVCLGEKGFSPCDGGTQCSTGFCTPAGACDLALGLPCTAGARCPGPLKCVFVPGAQLCLLKPQESCTGDRDCSSFFCRNGRCNRDDGQCDTNDECREPTQCSPTKICQLPNGQPCTSNLMCMSGFCTGTCQEAPLGSQCPFVCPPRTVCIGGGCVFVDTTRMNQQFLQASPDTLQGIQQLQIQRQQQQFQR